jgi:hypothetical protein
MEKMEEDYAAVHGPAPAATLARDGDLERLAGGNLLRVFGAAEAAAVRLAARRPPSTATIETLDGKKAP